MLNNLNFESHFELFSEDFGSASMMRLSHSIIDLGSLLLIFRIGALKKCDYALKISVNVKESTERYGIYPSLFKLHARRVSTRIIDKEQRQ